MQLALGHFFARAFRKLKIGLSAPRNDCRSHCNFVFDHEMRQLSEVHIDWNSRGPCVPITCQKLKVFLLHQLCLSLALEKLSSRSLDIGGNMRFAIVVLFGLLAIQCGSGKRRTQKVEKLKKTFPLVVMYGCWEEMVDVWSHFNKEHDQLLQG